MQKWISMQIYIGMDMGDDVTYSHSIQIGAVGQGYDTMIL